MPAQALREIVRFVRANSPFYAELYAGLPDDVSEISQLPLTGHTEFWAANSIRGGRVLTGPLSDAVVFKTGGTTGAPKFACYTREEWRDFSTVFSGSLIEAGLRPGHRVANLFYVGELYASFLFIQECLEHAAVDNVRLPIGGAAPWETAAATIEDFEAEVVAGTPTTLVRFAQSLAEGGRSLPSVELLLFGGEALYDDQREALAEAFPKAAPQSIGCASVDAGPIGACVPGADTRIHRAFAQHTIVEIIDETGAPVVVPDRPGRLIVTNLTRRLMPVLRYPVGDQAEWVGSDRRDFRLLGRADEGIRIGPISVYTDDLRQLVQAADPRVEGMQLIARHREQRDELIIRLAAHDPDETATATLVKAIYEARPMLADHAARGIVHPLRLEWVLPGELAVNPRTGKLVRVLDERLSG